MKLDAEDRCSDKFWRGVHVFWQSGRLCDMTLRSRSGECFQAHRLVIAASSDALAALVDGHFAEGQGGPVQLDVSSAVLTAMLSYLYGEEVDVPADDVIHLLQSAHMYGLGDLVNKVVTALSDGLDARLAVHCFTADLGMLGLDELEERCERYVAANFEECLAQQAYLQFSPSQLGRVLRHPDLAVACEEIVLQSLLRWAEFDPQRELLMSLLVQQVQFTSLALPSLMAVEKYAHKAGCLGADLQREARRGMSIHLGKEGRTNGPLSERRCFSHWWAGLGSSVAGGVLVAGSTRGGSRLDGLNYPSQIRLHNGALLIADRKNRRVVSWPLGATSGTVVAGRGAPLNGINDLGEWFAIDANSNEEVYVADRDNDRVLRFDGTGGEIVGQGQWQISRPRAIVSTSNGALYVIDQDGTRVQKLERGVATVVAGGNGAGEAPNQFKASMGDLVVSDAGDLYVADIDNHRVQHWAPGSTIGVTVAGGNGGGSMLNQLKHPHGVHVSRDKHLYIADTENHRVVRWSENATAGIVVAGGNGAGADTHQLNGPSSVVYDECATLYICEVNNHRITRWGPPPVLAI